MVHNQRKNEICAYDSVQWSVTTQKSAYHHHIFKENISHLSDLFHTGSWI